MGQLPHGSARTTEAVRRAIQHSQESLRALAKRHGINQSCAAADAPGEHRTRETVARWRRRTAVKDLPAGPKDARSTVLSIEEEAIIVAFGQLTARLHDFINAYNYGRRLKTPRSLTPYEFM